uniref:Reverse transcriptase domain-containing protein n=1 Tax=Cyprinus carpio carpio TaxID=630221 RepID=A0A9J8ACX2_CYPCA
MEEKVVSEILAISNISVVDLVEGQRLRLTELQNELDNIYKMRAQGAFIRSRQKWLEHGEQMSAYFFNLEKSRAKLNSVSKMNINGSITDNVDTISRFCYDYYSKLYTSKFSEHDMTSFCKQLKNVKTITEEDQKLCDSPITITEIKQAIELLKCNKSPGNDGITTEFYKQFSEILAPFLFEVYSESLQYSQLPTTMTQGIICLIPKPKKDVLLIDNWRPISLLNNDYKIFAQVFAQRFKLVLDSIIDENQSGFMRNRHICNNTRLIFDLIDYSDLIKDDSFILFLDFFKAFDSVEHPFIFYCLEHFGFGAYFCNAMKTLYAGGNSSVKLNNGTTQRFDLERGVRQGCPVSVYLFLIVAQVFCHFIKSSNLKGIQVEERSILISQLADDTALFLKNVDQIQSAVKIIEVFSSASGLCLNLQKCELFALKSCHYRNICNIPVKDSLTYLGMVITKNEQERISQNFDPVIKKVKNRFNIWLQRDLSLKGRVLLSKAEGISRLTYIASSIHSDNKINKIIDQIMLNFLWKNRIHYIRKSVIVNSYKNGGLDYLDFSTLNNTFKINWLKYFLNNTDSMWNMISKSVFDKLGGLSFLLMCDYRIEKLPVKLSAFHRQALLAWKLIYKHNFSPHYYYIWNNCNILYKHKSIFLKTWFDEGILVVGQLLNYQGYLMTYDEFLSYFNLPVSPKEFASVIGAISLSVVSLCRGISYSKRVSLLQVADTICGKVCFSTSKNNKAIRSLFQKELVSKPHVISYWSRFIGTINWNKVWLLPNKYIITNKVKEISFKILHKFYPAKHFLSKFNKDIDVNCSFCFLQPETVPHIFWHCQYTKRLWWEVSKFINNKLECNFLLLYEHVIFGFLQYEKSMEREAYIINLLIILVKFHIHRCKFTNQKPFFSVVLKELENYMVSIKDSTNKKAVKTMYLLNTFKIL